MGASEKHPLSSFVLLLCQTPWQKGNLHRERICLFTAYSLQCMVYHQGKSRQEVEADTTEGYCLLTCSIQSRTAFLENGATHTGLSWINNQDNPPQTCSLASLIQIIPQWGLPSLVTLRWQLHWQLKQTRTPPKKIGALQGAGLAVKDKNHPNAAIVG